MMMCLKVGKLQVPTKRIMRCSKKAVTMVRLRSRKERINRSRYGRFVAISANRHSVTGMEMSRKLHLSRRVRPRKRLILMKLIVISSSQRPIVGHFLRIQKAKILVKSRTRCPTSLLSHKERI